MKQKKHAYYAEVKQIIDGDTIKFEIDLGFYIKCTIKGRLAKINSPEGKNTPASDYIKSKILPGQIVWIETEKTQEKYGRWLVTVYKLDEEGNNILPSINESLLELGLAEKWIP